MIQNNSYVYDAPVAKRFVTLLESFLVATQELLRGVPIRAEYEVSNSHFRKLS